jgi:hypothetical protein
VAMETGGSKWGAVTGLEEVVVFGERCRATAVDSRARCWLVVGTEDGEPTGTGAAGSVLRCGVGFENIATLTTSILEFGSRLM